jgi:thiol:disulfide interchange protein DsbD
MASLLVVLVFVGLCAWVFGRLVAAKPSRSLAYLGAPLAVIAAIHIVGLRQALDAPRQNGAEARSLPQGWQAYSQTALDAALERKQPVFVDFTADWCLTCKYNESHVLQDAALLQSLHDKHVLMLRADWTRPDETIRTTLLRFGRAGVPMYLLYHPDSPQMPQLLPELLSASQLRDAVDNLP